LLQRSTVWCGPCQGWVPPAVGGESAALYARLRVPATQHSACSPPSSSKLDTRAAQQHENPTTRLHRTQGTPEPPSGQGVDQKLLNIIDEYTREALAIEADRSIGADKVVAVLDRLVMERGRPPAFLRFDNGPEFIAHAVANWATFNDVDTVFIDPGSPWQSAWIESFNSRLRDELLTAWQFDSLLEARVHLNDWRIDYNCNRPHTAHGDLTPTEFATLWATNQPKAA
jgi:putative transposase